MDDLTQLRQIEHGNAASAVGEGRKILDDRDDFAQQALAVIGNLLLGIPGPYFREVGYRRQASSKGGYFNESVRNVYLCERLE